MKVCFAFLDFEAQIKRLVTGGKHAPAEVRRGVGLVPRNVVENPITQQLHGVPAGIDGVVGAGYPQRPVGLEDPLARFEPRKVKNQSHPLSPCFDPRPPYSR